MIGVMRGTGSCVPAKVVDNDDLAKIVETSDAWIQERTGIARRHIVQEETTVSMACEAGKRALEDAGIVAEDIDMIIVSTMSSNLVAPCTACEVQKALGAVHAVCFDLNAACSGFVMAYETAMGYISGGVCKCVLVIGGESLSKLVDWTDRTTCILFGDGAGACVLKAEEGRRYLPVMHSDGGTGSAIICESVQYNRKTDGYIHMNGQEVFRFAVKKVPQVITEVLERNHLTKQDIDFYILHQANKRIVEGVRKRLEEDESKFPVNMQEYGNTSSASIPVLLDELRRKGELHAGDRIVLAGFGAGLTWAASVMDCV